MLENEQAVEATIQQDTVDNQGTTDQSNPEPVSTYKAPSEQEYAKALQSAASKAKFEILKELGVKSVQEFHDLKATYETSIQDAGNMKTELEESKSKITGLSEEISVMKLGIDDAHKEDFLTLVHSKVSADKSFEDAAKEVLERNPTWKVGNEPIKFGNDKSETKVDSSDEQRRKNILRMAGL